MPPRKSARGRGTGATPTPNTTPTPAPTMDAAAIEALVTERVAAALANANPPVQPGVGPIENNVNNNNQTGNPRPCTYKEFSDCKPRSFHGDGGVIVLSRWLEKLESVFEMCNCPEQYKVKYAASTFADSALSWWNEHVNSVGVVQANSMGWDEFKVLLREEYCPRSEIQNIEQEFWNLKMQGSELLAYNQRFSDLAVLCPGMVTPEYKKIERYIWGLAPQIQANVISSRPTTLLSAKTIAQKLTDTLIRQGTMEKKLESTNQNNNKRKRWDKKEEKSQAKEQHVVALDVITTTAPATQNPVRKQYEGKHPKCNRCAYHHLGECRKCTNCQKLGHTAPYCKAPVPTIPATNNSGITGTCYECGDTGHFKKNCPKRRKTGN